MQPAMLATLTSPPLLSDSRNGAAYDKTQDGPISSIEFNLKLNNWNAAQTVSNSHLLIIL